MQHREGGGGVRWLENKFSQSYQDMEVGANRHGTRGTGKYDIVARSPKLNQLRCEGGEENLDSLPGGGGGVTGKNKD